MLTTAITLNYLWTSLILHRDSRGRYRLEWSFAGLGFDGGFTGTLLWCLDWISDTFSLSFTLQAIEERYISSVCKQSAVYNVRTSVVGSFLAEMMDPESDLREVLLALGLTEDVLGLFEAETTTLGTSGLDSSLEKEIESGQWVLLLLIFAYIYLCVGLILNRDNWASYRLEWGPTGFGFDGWFTGALGSWNNFTFCLRCSFTLLLLLLL